jgi:hypothetical protein
MAIARSKTRARKRIPGRYSPEDIHRALFPNGPPKSHTVEEMKAGIERDIRERYARL